MASAVEICTSAIISALEQGGCETEAKSIREDVAAGEWTIAYLFGIVYVYRNGLSVPPNIADAILYTAKREEDEEAIEACKALLAKEPATVQ